VKPILFGFAAGAAIQAWRQFPPDGPLQPDSAVVIFLAGLVLAYCVGRFRGRGASASASATAIASASADATSVASNQTHVQVAFFTGGQGAGQQPALSAGAVPGVVVPDEVAWRGPARPALSADELDGADLSDLGLEVANDSPD
jgi:hypothetical protein